MRLAAAATDRARQTKARRGLHAPKAADSDGSEAAPQRYRTLRSFLLTWTELEGWTRRYDLAQLARDLTDEEYARFDRIVTATAAFRDELHQARIDATSHPQDTGVPAST